MLITQNLLVQNSICVHRIIQKNILIWKNELKMNSVIKKVK